MNIYLSSRGTGTVQYVKPKEIFFFVQNEAVDRCRGSVFVRNTVMKYWRDHRRMCGTIIILGSRQREWLIAAKMSSNFPRRTIVQDKLFRIVSGLSPFSVGIEPFLARTSL